jgi:protein-L-isoaspartate(D-aspartate) O-methyltransferase
LVATRASLLEELAPGIRDPRVLAAIGAVPRDRFVPRRRQADAWVNEALPIGHGQTISQPRVVAVMSELLEIEPGEKVLDIGTGSGYHAAVLSELGGEIWSIERDPDLSRAAAHHLADADIEGVHLIVGDGSLGHPPAAPYDAINVAASARERVPPALEDQLAPGGRLVVPVGERLVLVRRTETGRIKRYDAGGVRFVPLVEDA